ncbi:uncharacterized protein METZ01_LOCUS113936 [marine metagenome]|uniref:Uncharacterized protein n=1 Tax=marine metagenome TaxID=408172 RepID=A0A381X955_9ZZZZ
MNKENKEETMFRDKYLMLLEEQIELQKEESTNDS